MSDEEFTDTVDKKHSNKEFQEPQQKGKNKKKKNQKNNDVNEDDVEEQKQNQKKIIESMARADGDGSDSSEDDLISKKKGKNKAKKQQQKEEKMNRQKQGKKGKKGKQQDSDQEDDEAEEKKDESDGEEETKEQSKEETKDEENQEESKEEVPEFPLKVVYCAKCGVPPEFCAYGTNAKYIDECKTWLKSTHKDIYDELYDEIEEDGAEEEKKDAGGKPQKKKKGVVFAENTGKKIRVIRQSRGGKKACTSIFGLELYGCDLEVIAQTMAKKFGSGAAATPIDYKEERDRVGILIQGDVSERFEEFVENNLQKYNIDMKQIFFEDGGSKKNRTMGGGRTRTQA